MEADHIGSCGPLQVFGFDFEWDRRHWRVLSRGVMVRSVDFNLKRIILAENYYSSWEWSFQSLVPSSLIDIFLKLFKTWFWSDYRFKQGSIPCTFYPPPRARGYVLHNYRTISKPGNLTLEQCVCIGLCHFIMCVDPYNHHHNQDWQLFSHRKDLFCATPS